MAQGPEQTESCLTPALGLLGFCVAFPFPAHLPPHIVCILYGSPETQLRPQLIREPFSPAVCSGGRHTSPYRVSALFPWSGLLLMGGPDTIYLAGNEQCELAPGHLYLLSGAPALSALRHWVVAAAGDQGTVLAQLQFSDSGRAPLWSLAKGTKNTGVA